MVKATLIFRSLLALKYADYGVFPNINNVFYIEMGDIVKKNKK